MRKYIYAMTFLFMSGLSFGTKLQSPDENATLNNVIIINASKETIMIHNNDEDGWPVIPPNHYLYSSNMRTEPDQWGVRKPLPIGIEVNGHTDKIEPSQARDYMAVVIERTEELPDGKLKTYYFTPGGGTSPIIEAIKEWGMKIEPMDQLINNPD